MEGRVGERLTEGEGDTGRGGGDVKRGWGRGEVQIVRCCYSYHLALTLKTPKLKLFVS